MSKGSGQTKFGGGRPKSGRLEDLQKLFEQGLPLPRVDWKSETLGVEEGKQELMLILQVPCTDEPLQAGELYYILPSGREALARAEGQGGQNYFVAKLEGVAQNEKWQQIAWGYRASELVGALDTADEKTSEAIALVLGEDECVEACADAAQFDPIETLLRPLVKGQAWCRLDLVFGCDEGQGGKMRLQTDGMYCASADTMRFCESCAMWLHLDCLTTVIDNADLDWFDETQVHKTALWMPPRNPPIKGAGMWQAMLRTPIQRRGRRGGVGRARVYTWFNAGLGGKAGSGRHAYGAVTGHNKAASDGLEDVRKEMERPDGEAESGQAGARTDKQRLNKARERALEDEVNLAYIGKAVINIVDPPFGDTEFVWGVVNERPVAKKTVKELAKAFNSTGKIPEKAPISVGIEAGWINLTTLTKEDRPWGDLPRLEWKESVHGCVVEFYDGHHRMLACKEWGGMLDNAKEQLEKKKARKVKNSEEIDRELDVVSKDRKEAHSWVVNFHIKSMLGPEAKAHLSENLVRPYQPPSKEEMMFMARQKLLNATAAWINDHQDDEAPEPGSKPWREEIYNTIFSETERRAPYMFLFTNRHTFAILGAMCKFSYLRNGTSVTLKTLTAALRPNSRSSGSSAVPTAGYLWGWVLRAGVEQMAIVASAAGYPEDVRIQAPAGPGRVLGSYLALLEGPRWAVSKATRTQLGLAGEDWKTDEESLQLAKRTELARIREMYEEITLEWCDGEKVRDVVWANNILDAINLEYEGVFRKGGTVEPIDVMGANWTTAMQSYSSTVGTVGQLVWKAALDREEETATQTATADDDRVALRNAGKKWALLCTLGRHGETLDLPLPTQSFLQDLWSEIDAHKLGIQWVVRSIDGLTDSVIRLLNNPAFDYVSHMIELKRDVRLFRTSEDAGDAWCRWLISSLPLLAHVSALLSKVVTEEMQEYYNLTQYRWREKILKNHAPVGKVPEELPPLLRDMMPGLEWSEEDRCAVAEASTWIQEARREMETKKSDGDGAIIDDVCRTLPQLSSPIVKKHPGLYMLFRTGRDWWKDDGGKSWGETSWMYAYQCLIGFKLWTQTSARIMADSKARTLRLELRKLLSSSCQQACARRNLGGDWEWVFWDDLVIDELVEDAGLLPKVGLRMERVGAREELRLAEKREGRCQKVQEIVNSVRKLECARSEDSEGLHPWVAAKLRGLCEVSILAVQKTILLTNGTKELLEIGELRDSRREPGQQERPYVRRGRSLLDSGTIDFGPISTNEGAFASLEDFADAAPDAHGEYLARLAAEGLRLEDGTQPQDIDWSKHLDNHDTDGNDHDRNTQGADVANGNDNVDNDNTDNNASGDDNIDDNASGDNANINAHDVASGGYASGTCGEDMSDEDEGLSAQDTSNEDTFYPEDDDDDEADDKNEGDTPVREDVPTAEQNDEDEDVSMAEQDDEDEGIGQLQGAGPPVSKHDDDNTDDNPTRGEVEVLENVLGEEDECDSTAGAMAEDGIAGDGAETVSYRTEGRSQVGLGKEAGEHQCVLEGKAEAGRETDVPALQDIEEGKKMGKEMARVDERAVDGQKSYEDAIRSPGNVMEVTTFGRLDSRARPVWKNRLRIQKCGGTGEGLAASSSRKIEALGGERVFEAGEGTVVNGRRDGLDESEVTRPGRGKDCAGGDAVSGANDGAQEERTGGQAVPDGEGEMEGDSGLVGGYEPRVEVWKSTQEMSEREGLHRQVRGSGIPSKQDTQHMIVTQTNVATTTPDLHDRSDDRGPPFNLSDSTGAHVSTSEGRLPSMCAWAAPTELDEFVLEDMVSADNGTSTYREERQAQLPGILQAARGRPETSGTHSGLGPSRSTVATPPSV
ncbi:hypothetical protein LXA43DRAFT_1086356 [Ganoderma leucocontextum]|nr:hypothetical protein LXA43DRAFT_1086356 [Ganoderma leucocontextum]